MSSIRRQHSKYWARATPSHEHIQTSEFDLLGHAAHKRSACLLPARTGSETVTRSIGDRKSRALSLPAERQRILSQSRPPVSPATPPERCCAMSLTRTEGEYKPASDHQVVLARASKGYIQTWIPCVEVANLHASADPSPQRKIRAASEHQSATVGKVLAS